MEEICKKYKNISLDKEIDKEKDSEKILNPKTGRYVLKTGIIGKKILKERYIIKETLANGNCFYSAVYRSLKYKNLLKKFFENIPGLNSKTENEFINKSRLYISNKSKVIKDYYDLFDNIEKNLKNEKNYILTLKEIMKSVGDVRIVIKKFVLENKFKDLNNKNDFVKEIQEIIKSDRTYVGEIEVLNFIKTIEKSDIKVYTNKKVKEYEKNSINLILRHEHWEYI